MPQVRGSDVFLASDIQSILTAILATNEMVARDLSSAEAQAYRRGFATAIAAVATALHINLMEMQPGAQLDVSAARLLQTMMGG